MLSLFPEDQEQGSAGLQDDTDATVMGATFALFNYQGKGKLTVALILSLAPAGGGDPIQQAWSAGDPDKVQPSKDGTTPSPDGTGPHIIGLKGQKGVHNSTKTGAFFRELLTAGFANKTGLNTPGVGVSALVGMSAHWKEIPFKMPEDKNPQPGAKKREDGKVLVPSKIHGYGGAQSAPQAIPAGFVQQTQSAPQPVQFASQGVPVQAQQAPTGGVSPLDEKLHNKVMEVLVMNGGKVARAQLSTKVFAAMAGDPDQTGALRRVLQDEFLKSIPGVTYDGREVSL